MSSRAVLVDLGIAVGFAIAALILAPGLGVVALLAILIVLACVVSFGLERWRGRRSRPRRRLPPRRR